MVRCGWSRSASFVMIIMLAVFLERFAFCRLNRFELVSVPVCIMLIIFPYYTSFLAPRLLLVNAKLEESELRVVSFRFAHL